MSLFSHEGKPLYNTDDRVVYVGGQLEDEAEGTVRYAVAHTTYTYVVEWDDGDPTDEYEQHQLSAKE